MKYLAFLVLCAVAFAQPSFFLKPNDTVVFYGDSITDQRLYTTFVETYVVTRFPKSNITFVHSGWSGDRVTGGGGGPIDLRLRRDVFAYRPTVVTVMLGMNDGRYRAFDQAIFDEYANGYRSIVKAIKTTLPEARITLIQPSPYDDVTRPPMFDGGYNSVLQRYGQFLKELAAKENVFVADMNTPVIEELKKALALDSANATRLIPDRVHPGPGGHWLMAKALLKAWNAPATITAVELDAETKKAVKSENTVVDGFDGARWTQTDNALPMPLDPKDPLLMLAVKSYDTVDSVNQELLKVTGLESARYKLAIDGETVGTFTKEELAVGISLATMQTPMMKQAADVHAMTLRHNNIHNARWRVLQVPLANDGLPSAQSAMDALDKLESELVSKQRTAAQPKSHAYELTPAE